MKSKSILIIYLILFFLAMLADLVLSLLNIKHVRKNSKSIPEPFKDIVDQEAFSRSIEYTLTKEKFGVISSIFSSVVVLAVVLSGSFGWLDGTVSLWHLHPYLHGVVYILLASLFFTVTSIPFSLYSVFVIEERFGFNTMTFKLWVVDQLKGLVLSAAVITPILLGIFWFMDKTGGLWWIYAFCFIAAAQLVLMYIFPVFIAPLFNKFTPLGEGGLKDAIKKLCGKLEFKFKGVYLMDGSKRSKHANAYFTGFGKNKRIVLFDTLIDTLDEQETLSVLAHEVGHQKLKHVLKSIAFSFALMLAGLWLLSLLIDYLPFFEAFGFRRVSYHGALIIFSFAAEPVMFFVSPLFSLLSRKHEYEADRFAVSNTPPPEALSQALVKLSKRSLSNLTPHPLYSFFHYSHPTLLERIKAIRSVPR